LVDLLKTKIVRDHQKECEGQAGHHRDVAAATRPSGARHGCRREDFEPEPIQADQDRRQIHRAALSFGRAKAIPRATIR
jgi:hypothetical protein